jgi:iron complex outermembrane recepter protein
LSLGYLILGGEKSFIKKIEPFLTYSNYNFKYADFKTIFKGAVVDYSNKQVVGVPPTKYTVGLDITTNAGLYLNNTYNYLGDVYTDFDNTNSVKGFGLLNSKIGYKKTGKKVDFDIYLAGNNVNDSDAGSNYPAGVATDVNPGPSKAYFFGGANLKFKF